VARNFDLAKIPSEAVLHITAQGLYRAFVNGVRVGDDLLTAGWTCYDDRIAFQSYDIASLLKRGANRIEVWLGDGWYRGRLMWALNPIVDTWGDRMAALAEIVAGGQVILASDAHWTSGFLPVLENGIYYGEDVDARVIPQDSAGVEVLAFDTSLLVPARGGRGEGTAAHRPARTMVGHRAAGL
jgi:alpha-L-rhamnosidase